MGNVNANPDPAKLNQVRSGWLYDYSQVNNKYSNKEVRLKYLD